MHDTLVVCPVGVLEMVNFDAIKNNKSRLMDRYQIYRAYSGHSFINGARSHRYSPRTAALFGGIAYSKEQKQEAEIASSKISDYLEELIHTEDHFNIYSIPLKKLQRYEMF